MCVNTGYNNLILSQVEELLINYNVDGFWFDIYQSNRLCYCDKCIELMLSQGIDYKNSLSVEEFNSNQIKQHCNTLVRLIHRYTPNAEVFNGTTAIDNSANFQHQIYENNTTQDLEDLPTMWEDMISCHYNLNFLLMLATL